MLSESARMSSAAEARFRVPVPPPTSRAVAVIALDRAADGVVGRLAGRAWAGTRFVRAPDVVAWKSDRGPAVLADPVLEELASADLVVMVADAGADVPAASPIGQYCSRRNVTTATFVVGAASASDEALSRTLEQVRPWSLMVIVAHDDDYLEDVLKSFR